MQTVCHFDLLRRQHGGDGLDVLLRQQNVVVPARDRLQLTVPLDFRLHNAAHRQMVHSLFAAPRQIVQVHDLVAGQRQLHAPAGGEGVSFKPVFIHVRIQKFFRRIPQIHQHHVLSVLRVPQRSVYLHAAVAVGGEERIRICHVQRNFPVSPLPAHAAHHKAFRPLAGPCVLLIGKRPVVAGQRGLDSTHRVPHGLQLRHIHVSNALAAQRGQRIQQTAAFRQRRVYHHIPLVVQNIIIDLLEPVCLQRPSGGVAVRVFPQPPVFVVAVRALQVNIPQQGRHHYAQLLRNVLLVRGIHQFAGDCAGVPCDPRPHRRCLPFFAALLGLLVVLFPQRVYVVPALLPLAGQHLTHTTDGLLRTPVCIRFLLPHLIGNHAVDQLIGDLLHRRIPVSLKGIVVNAVKAIQHIPDLQQFVRLRIHVAGEIALAEHLRQLAIHGIHRRAIGLVQFQRSHVALSKIAVVCHVPAELDGLPLQIVPNFQQLRAVLRQLRGVVHNGLRHGLGVWHQIHHRHVPLHHSFGKRVHLALHVRVFHIAAVLADEILPQLFHVPQHHGRFLADAHFAFQLLYPLLQRLVLLGQRVSLLFEFPRLALHLRRASQLIADIVTFCECQVFCAKKIE